MNIFREIPTIQTQRLILRKIKYSDLEDLYHYTSNENVTRYLSYHHSKIDDALKYIQTKLESYEKGTCMIWGLEDKKSGKLIGQCGFTQWNKSHYNAEVAYTLSEEYWGKGLGSELLSLLLTFGFEVMKLHRVEARCWSTNLASAKLLEKCGLQYEGLLKESIYAKGEFRDVKQYAILKTAINT